MALRIIDPTTGATIQPKCWSDDGAMAFYDLPGTFVVEVAPEGAGAGSRYGSPIQTIHLGAGGSAPGVSRGGGA